MLCPLHHLQHLPTVEKSPQSWKESSTKLFYKNKGEKSDISSWRPIALATTISKLYSKVLAGRLSRWIEKNEVLSHCQKGFMPYDGVLEQERINRVLNGTFTRFVDWRFVHRARLDLLPTLGKPWKDETKCRRCDFESESLGHVLNHCPPALTNIQKRHDDIVRRIKTAVGNPRTGCELLYENRTIPCTPLEHRRKRPDLVIKNGNKIYVVDVTIPFENGEDAFKEAREKKREKSEYTKALQRKG